MSEITNRFNIVYQENLLHSKDYYIYGSGGGALGILKFIADNDLTPPIAILDREEKSEPVKTTNAYQMQQVLYPVVVSSISFYNDIKHELLKSNQNFKNMLIPLMPYSENVSNRLYISDSAWQEYQALSESNYRSNKQWQSSTLSKNGFYIGLCEPALINAFHNECLNLQVQPQSIETSRVDFDYFSNFHASVINPDLDRLGVTAKAAQYIKHFFDAHYDEIAQQLGSHFRVVNCRITRLSKVKNSNIDSNKLHLDSMPKAVKKILLYITPPSEINGSTLLHTEDQQEYIVDGPAGTWLLFQNSRLLHRGLSSEQLNRLVCEITITSSQYKNTAIRSVGQVSEYPYKPWQRCGHHKVNLGGGANDCISSRA
jgi:hypothetical protein